MLTWDPNHAIGIEEIDAQHAMLVEHYNHVISCNDAGEFSEALSNLRDYLHFHFKTEEAMMRELGHADLARHTQAHRDFIATLEMTEARIEREPEHRRMVPDLLKLWINHHIVDCDGDLARLASPSPIASGSS